MSVRVRKAINFDLDTKALKEFYPGKDYRAAYGEIKNFMENNGFEHRQWSGYVSVKALDQKEIVSSIKKIAKKFPWLSQCVNRFDVTNISKTYDMVDMIKNTSARQQDTFEETKPPIQDTQGNGNVLSQIRSALDESDRQADIFKSFGFNDEAKASQTKIQKRL